MKTKLVLLIALTVLCVMGFLFRSSEEPVSSASKPLPQQLQTDNKWLDKFFIGATDADYDYVTGYSNLHQLGFNLWHTYSGQETIGNKNYPKLLWSDRYPDKDNLLNPVSVYSGDVNNFIDLISNSGERNLTIMRPKIQWLCYGQRSDYVCNDDIDDPELWFYHFQPQGQTTGSNTTDNSIFGNGKKVRRCLATPSYPDNPGYIVARLKANTEQSHIMRQNEGDQWFGDSECEWYIKPRIRADQSFISNPANFNVVICSVDIYNQDGYDQNDPTLNRILHKVIKAGDFQYSYNNPYNGDYMEEFYFNNQQIPAGILVPPNSSGNHSWGTKWVYSARGNHYPDSTNDNHSDIRVYWNGVCDMWIDYVRVDNDVADQLFKGYYDNPNDPDHRWIYNEVTQIGNHIPSGTPEPAIIKYYLELVEFNNLPCMAYVDSLLKQYSNGKADLMQDLTNTISVHVPWDNRTSVENVTFLFHKYIQKVGFTQVFTESYPMTACYTTNPNQQCFSMIPNTLPNISGNTVLAQPVNPSLYDTWLQDNLNHKPYLLEEGGTDISCALPCGQFTSNDLHQDNGNFRFQMNLGDSLSKKADIPFIFMPQAHQWFRSAEVRREPTNEELQMMANVAVSYGVKGILYFMYYSFQGADYGTGMTTPGNSSELRDYNYYHQGHDNVPISKPYKWETIQNITNRLSEKWGPYLIGFNNADRHSYIYDDPIERSHLISNTYFNDIYTYQPDISNLGQPSSNPENQSERYVQAAVFNNNDDQYTNYFMIVNRRCSPFYGFNAETGGVRNVKIQFDENHSSFNGFNNWKIIDLENNSAVLTFDKRSNDLLNLGWYMPGEGKLYKIVPVMIDGGTLVCDEEIGNGIESFECKGEAISNGYNISIPNKLTISFHPEGKITMNGGQFICGQSLQNREIIFQGYGPYYWNGFEFNDCENIDIRNCKFIKSPEIAPGTQDYVYSLKVTNCNCLILTNSEFIYENTALSGAVKIDFIHYFTPRTLYIGNNTFSTGVSTAPVVNITSFTSNEIPVLMEYNNFIASEGNLRYNAMLFSNITGGAIKNNTFTNYLISVELLSTSLDFYANTITCNSEGAVGIECIENTFINMSPVNSINLGGENTITNRNIGVENIRVTNSMFFIQDGYNTFDISSTENSGCHLQGYFPEKYYEPEVGAQNNCFRKDGNYSGPVQSVNWGDASINPVIFNFNPTSCTYQEQENLIVFELNNNIYDTVRTNNLTIQNTPKKQLYDSININVRKNDYQRLSLQGYSFLNNYADSIESVDIISKLYLASLVLDSSGSKILPLKSFYESLIQNHSQDTVLISRAYYFIQKCKVALTDYQSALTGFQDIMNQNPYTYEGLLASWDYSATTLLMGGGGSFKEQLPTEDFQIEVEENSENEVFQILITQMLDTLRKDRKTIITNSTEINQNKLDYKKLLITKNIENVFEGNRKKTENRIKDLEKKIKSDNEKIRKEAAKELIRMKKLGEVIKVKNPKDVEEHIKFVNRDIKKVFGGSSNTIENKKISFIPTEYALHQNYPNPFNPVTKISFDLPKDSKVKLIVYDILGREIKILLNSEFRPAGKHVAEFNSVNLSLASGVYFYRIETDKFIAVKKMVMIK